MKILPTFWSQNEVYMFRGRARKTHYKNSIKKVIVFRDLNICCYCGHHIDDNNITLEHIIPYSKNGLWNYSNITISCYYHNNIRGNKDFFKFVRQFNFSDKKLNKYKFLYKNSSLICDIKSLFCFINNMNKNTWLTPSEIISSGSLLFNQANDFNKYKNFNLNCDKFKINFFEPVNKTLLMYYFVALSKFIDNQSFSDECLYF